MLDVATEEEKRLRDGDGETVMLPLAVKLGLPVSVDEGVREDVTLVDTVVEAVMEVLTLNVVDADKERVGVVLGDSV